MHLHVDRGVAPNRRRPPADEETVERTRVLVVEDDPMMRRLMADSLRRDGYVVDEARSGQELMRRVGSGARSHPSTRPDLIVSDVRMPGYSGLQVLSMLRQEDWAMPVILVTAFGDPSTHAEARRLGAAAVLDKPFDMGRLRSLVRGLVPTEL